MIYFAFDTLMLQDNFSNVIYVYAVKVFADFETQGYFSLSVRHVRKYCWNGFY